MKNTVSRWLLILILGISFSACDLSVDTEVTPPEDKLKAALPQIQYYTAYWAGSDLTRYQLIWMQQQAGFRGSHLQVDKYNMNPSYLDAQWNFFYNNIYFACQNTITTGIDADAPAYSGISRIMQAVSLGLMTDTWGAIPYYYAMGYFSGGFYPQYDTQEEIYQYIMQLLESGINDLNSALAGSAITPGPDEDLIYQGDLEKWRRAANVLQMRYYLRLANLTGGYESIAFMAQGMETFRGPQDDMTFYFDPAFNLENPHYYHDTSIRNARIGKFFVDKLKETSDPRLPVFVEANDEGQFVGSAPGEGLATASFIGPGLASQHSELPLITYTEQKFIEAELYSRMMLQGQADQAFEEAVKSSLTVHGVSDPQWEAIHAEVENVTLEQIINAKYIALALQPEVWTDFRRTGFPQLTPYEGVERTEIPRRFIYPSNELNMNEGNVPANVTIYTSVWWDTPLLD